MLLGENRRRAEDSDLVAVHHRLERGTDRDFGLTVADVAANEPVHRLLRFHVDFDFLDGGELVRRLVVDERGLEFALPGRVRRQGVAFERCSCGLDFEEFARKIHDGALGSELLFLP